MQGERVRNVQTEKVGGEIEKEANIEIEGEANWEIEKEANIAGNNIVLVFFCNWNLFNPQKETGERMRIFIGILVFFGASTMSIQVFVLLKFFELGRSVFRHFVLKMFKFDCPEPEGMDVS